MSFLQSRIIVKSVVSFTKKHNQVWQLSFKWTATHYGVLLVQATTVIVDTVIVESTARVEQKPLTTQFYLLLVE